MVSVSDRRPNLGEVVTFHGIKACVSFNPFSQKKSSLGFLYKHPHDEVIFWREMWPSDEYE
jgi:hypothetical protein